MKREGVDTTIDELVYKLYNLSDKNPTRRAKW